MQKNLKLILIVIGVLLILAGVLLTVVIVPSMRVFPTDVDTTRTYDVDYLTLLNPTDLSFVRIGSDESEDIHIVRRIEVVEVDGNQTLIRETQTLMNGETPVRPPFVKYHALDRGSMAFLKSSPEEWIANEEYQDGYWQREGLVIGWGPEGVEQRDYVGWNDDTRTTTEMVFVEEREYSGMDTYYFTAGSEAMPIDAEHVAALGMPPVLPVAALGDLAAGMDIEDESLKTTIQTFLPMLFSAAIRETQDVEAGTELYVPLIYYYDYYGEYWVEPTTGVLINTHKMEHRAVTFPPEIMEHVATALDGMGMDSSVLESLLPLTINEFEYAATAESVEDAKNDAQEVLDKLNMFGKTIPMIAIALGGLALIGGWYLSFFVPQEEE